MGVTGAPWDRCETSSTTRGFAMSHLQPTVRQLQPLGRRYHSAAIMPEEVDTHAREAETVSQDARTSTRRRPRWPRWLTARASPSS
jgi:hypothetical protein